MDFQKQYKKEGDILSLSVRLINFVLQMYIQLTPAQRHAIFVLLKKNVSVKGIADTTNVHYGTVYRELRRKRDGNHYHYGVVQKQCDERKRRMRKHRKFSIWMRKGIVALIANGQWLPEQARGGMLRKGKEVRLCRNHLQPHPLRPFLRGRALQELPA